MKKNEAGQVIVAQMLSSTDGSAFTGTVAVSVLGDGGTQTAGGGTVAHKGNGVQSYIPTQAETNFDHIAFTFTGTGAITTTIQLYTTFPQTADSAAGVTTLLARMTATRSGYLDNLTNLDSTVSSRSTYAGADTAGTATLLSRIASAITITSGKVDVNDKTGYSLSQAFPANFSSLGISAAGKINEVILTDTTTNLTNAPSGGLDAAGVRSAVGLAAANLDNQLSGINTKTTNLPSDPASNTQVNTRLASSAYTAAPSATDNASAVRTELATELAKLDVSVSTRNAVAPDNATIDDIAAALALAMGVSFDTSTDSLHQIRLNALTSLEVENAVLDAPSADHNLPDSIGNKINSAGLSGDPWSITNTALATYPADSCGQQFVRFSKTGDGTGPLTAIPAPDHPNNCVCFLDTGNLQSGKRAGISVSFALSSYPAVGDGVLEIASVTKSTDADGRLIVMLPRTDTLSPVGVCYLVNSTALGIVNMPLFLSVELFDLTEWVRQNS